jgi:hypothetical protein
MLDRYPVGGSIAGRPLKAAATFAADASEGAVEVTCVKLLEGP